MSRSTIAVLSFGLTLMLILIIASYWNDRMVTVTTSENEYYCMVNSEWLEVDEYRVSSMFTSYYILDGDRHDYSDVLTCKTDVTPVSRMANQRGIESFIKDLIDKIF